VPAGGFRNGTAEEGLEGNVASRALDWFRQAERDLRLARVAAEAGSHDWACFAAQQAAEKAVKAVYLSRNCEAWGYSVTALLSNLPADARPGDDLIDGARELDRHYIPSRYPNSHPQGAPYEYYSGRDSARAVGYAESILRFCARLLD